ncbi:MAG: PTS lactose transporter subunit IIB [Ardenticatenia bacterium]|nr:MAG: PTS lactose transporter subunit IIB [Ardenticatenia bacterium]
MARSISASDVNTIVVACEAGMGSSLMTVNALKKKLKKAKVQGVTVQHKAVSALPADTKLVVVHKGLAKVAQSKAPNAVIVVFSHFLNDPVLDKVVQAFAEQGAIESNLE